VLISKIINGKISNNVIGAFRKERKYGYNGLIFIPLKKEISSRIFRIIDNVKKIKLIKKYFPKNF
jgi:hypothetical protein